MLRSEDHQFTFIGYLSKTLQLTPALIIRNVSFLYYVKEFYCKYVLQLFHLILQQQPKLPVNYRESRQQFFFTAFGNIWLIVSIFSKPNLILFFFLLGITSRAFLSSTVPYLWLTNALKCFILGLCGSKNNGTSDVSYCSTVIREYKIKYGLHGLVG